VQTPGQDAELPEQSSPSLQEGWPAECAASGMQVPAAQEPHGPQALSQQTTETQCADWHWLAPEHAAPFGCRAKHRSFWPVGMCWQPALHTWTTLAAPPADAHE
jgi:hypothetical protein